MVLSEESYHLALAIAPKISGSLSIIGSSFIIRDIFNRRRGNRQYRGGGNERGGQGHNNNIRSRRQRMSQSGSQINLQQRGLPATSRVILNMSVADIGSSCWAHVLSTWLVPKDGSDNMAVFAAGNQATCTAQSFFYELFLYSGLWSNAILAVAYWLTICREMNESTLRRWKWQGILLGLPWLFGLINAVPKLILGSAGYNGYWWCELVGGTAADNLLDQIVLVVCFLTIIASMFALARYVYMRERRLDRFAISTGQSNGEMQHQNREKTIQVTYQGLYYILIWLAIVVPSIPITIREHDLPREYLVFWACLFPLQGFGNTLVYFRPKYRAIMRREDRQQTGRRRLSAVAQVLDVSVPQPVTRLAESLSSRIRRLSGGSNTGVLDASDLINAEEPHPTQSDRETTECMRDESEFDEKCSIHEVVSEGEDVRKKVTPKFIRAKSDVV